MQENLLAVRWILRRRLGIGPAVAYWGPARTSTRAPGGFRETSKRGRSAGSLVVAHTSITIDPLRAGFPRSNHALGNAIDAPDRCRWAGAPADEVKRTRYGVVRTRGNALRSLYPTEAELRSTPRTGSPECRTSCWS